MSAVGRPTTPLKASDHHPAAPGASIKGRIGQVSFEFKMPLDPFADDPNDPASFLEADEPMPPLSDEERQDIQRDLALVSQFKRFLEPKGILGIFFLCEDCGINHYFDWDILASNMRATLAEKISPVHEPSANPTVECYVPWDYAVGYLDGMRGR